MGPNRYTHQPFTQRQLAFAGLRETQLDGLHCLDKGVFHGNPSTRNSFVVIEQSMTLTKPVPPDRSKIDMQDLKQVKLWARKLNILPEKLAKVVEKVGNSAAEVRKELARSRC